MCKTSVVQWLQWVCSKIDLIFFAQFNAYSFHSFFACFFFANFLNLSVFVCLTLFWSFRSWSVSSKFFNNELFLVRKSSFSKSSLWIAVDESLSLHGLHLVPPEEETVCSLSVYGIALFLESMFDWQLSVSACVASCPSFDDVTLAWICRIPPVDREEIKKCEYVVS